MCLPSLVGNWKSPFLARGMTGLLFVCLLFLFLLSLFENTAFPFLRPRSNLFVPQTPVEKGNHSGQLTFPSATPPQQRNLVLNLVPTSSPGIPEACEVQEWTPVSVTAPRTEPVTLTKSYVCVLWESASTNASLYFQGKDMNCNFPRPWRSLRNCSRLELLSNGTSNQQTSG